MHVPQLGYITHYEGVWRSIDTAVYVLNTCNGCMLMARGTPKSLYPLEDSPNFPYVRRPNGPRDNYKYFGES